MTEEFMDDAEQLRHDAKCNEFLRASGSIHQMAEEFGSPHMVCWCAPLLEDYGHALMGLASDFVTLLEMLQVFARENFADREHYAEIVAPKVALKLWYSGGMTWQ